MEPRFCHCSPLHPTTLSAATRAAAGIPKSAAHFAWVYPASRIPFFVEKSIEKSKIPDAKTWDRLFFNFEWSSSEASEALEVDKLKHPDLWPLRGPERAFLEYGGDFDEFLAFQALRNEDGVEFMQICT